MKKIVSLALWVLIIILLCVVIDVGSIFVFFKPIWGIMQYCDCKQHVVYRGVFYDTYCFPEYTVPQIKPKWYECEKSSQIVGNGKVIQIVDKTKNIKDFTCAEALEGFWNDETYEYYFSCIKGKYIIVKYENGYEETVREALRRGTIEIQDLDFYGIGYIKYEK